MTMTIVRWMDESLDPRFSSSLRQGTDGSETGESENGLLVVKFGHRVLELC